MCQLIDFCANINCRVDQDCVNGICVDNPNFCRVDFDCQPGLICLQELNLCIADVPVDPCANVNC